MVKLNRCPHCKQVITFAAHSGDFVHECNSQSDVFDKEDIVAIGNWSDYTGSGEVSNIMLQGVNEIKNEECNITDRGNRITTHRQRQHLEYIENPENTEK